MAADDELGLVMTPGGQMVLAPRSIRSLRGEALEISAELQRAVADVERARLRSYELAAELRAAGASWAAIGWCMGVSESRARQIVNEQENPDA